MDHPVDADAPDTRAPTVPASGPTEAAAPPWRVVESSDALAFVVEQLRTELFGCVAIALVESRNRTVLAHHSQFDALGPNDLGQALYHLAGSAIEATHDLGGRSWFGEVEDGLVVTEAAVVHYRLVGSDHAVIAVGDRPIEAAHLDTNRRILAAYDPVLLEQLNG